MPSRGLSRRSWYSYTAFVVALSVLAWSLGLPGFLSYARADAITNLSDTISTSRPGLDANHTIEFTAPTDISDNGETLTITFPGGFDLTDVDEDDIDIADDGTDLETAADCNAADEVGVSVLGQAITFEFCNGDGVAVATSSVVTIEIGDNATHDGSGADQINNQSTPDSYEVVLGGTWGNQGTTQIAIIEGVVVTGQVETNLIFSIDGVDAGLGANGDTTTGTTTATAIPFGTTTPDSEYVMAQDVSVTTNAGDGFTVTVLADGDLEGSTGAIIDAIVDGSGASTPIAWPDPSADPLDSTTFGHWGIASEDTTLSTGDEFGSQLYAGDFISNAREIMYATTSANGTTADVGQTRVSYKLEVTTLQEADSDYTTRLVYVVTPIF